MRVKIDAWYYGFIDAPNGVVTFLQYFNEKFKTDKYVDFRILSLGTMSQRKDAVESEPQIGLKKHAKSAIITLLTYVPYFSFFFLKKAFIGNAKNVVGKFRESE